MFNMTHDKLDMFRFASTYFWHFIVVAMEKLSKTIKQTQKTFVCNNDCACAREKLYFYFFFFM